MKRFSEKQVVNFISIISASLFFAGIMSWFAALLSNVFSDPDNWMHMDFMQQVLTGNVDTSKSGLLGSITNYWYLRDNAGAGGMEIIWTLPYDLLILLCSLPALLLGYGIHDSLESARVFIGPLCFFFCIMSAWYILSAFSLKSHIVKNISWTTLFMFMSLSLIGYSLPYRISHHPFTLALSLLALGNALFLIRFPCKKYGIYLGLLVVMASWSSMETLPFLLLVNFIVWASSIFLTNSDYRKNAINYYVLSTIGFGALALIMDHPMQGILSLRIDRYSIVQFLILVMAASFNYVFCRASQFRMNNALKLTTLVGLSALFLGVVVSLIMVFVPMPIDMSDSLIVRYFWRQNAENLSLFTDRTGLKFFMFPCIPALVMALIITLKRVHKKDFVLWVIFTLFLLGCDFEGVMSLRLNVYPSAISGMFLCVLFQRFASRLNGKRKDKYKSDIILSMALFITGIALLTFSLYPQSIKQVTPDKCLMDANLGKKIFDEFGNNANIMTDIWDAPSILWFTYDKNSGNNSGVNVVGGPYHPNKAGLHDEALFWSSDYSNAENSNNIMQMIKARHLKGAVSCVTPLTTLPQIFNKNSIQMLLLNKKHPSWMIPVDVKNYNGSFQIYRFNLPE